MGRRCCDLPEEVLVEIFSWVPPQSLIRFKCVSKSWYALINSLIKNPEFVNKHLRNVDNKVFSSATCLVFSPPAVFWQQHSKRGSVFTSLTIFDGVNCVGEVFDLDTPLSKLITAEALMSDRSHCNGIICLASNRTVILCNPAIKECRTLPKSCLPISRKGMGFGYDSKANDYKVVRFGIDTGLLDRNGNGKRRAEVYSMRTDSWREIGFHLSFLPTCTKEVFWKGVFYWLTGASENIIISFDISDEVFHSIPLQSNLFAKRGNHLIKLAVWNESVALFCYDWERGFTDTVKVWVMDDCTSGVNGSCFWTKKLAIGPLVDTVAPLIFLKNDNILMKGTDGSLILYHIRTQMVRRITSIQAANKYARFEFSYVHSLVSVQGGSHYDS